MKHIMYKLIILCIVSLVVSDALRILVFFPMPSRSHSILGHGVTNNLLAAGHEVVHVTSFPRNAPEAKLKEIDLTAMAEKFKAQSEKSDEFKFRNLVGKPNFGDSLPFLFFAFGVHQMMLEEPKLLQLLGDPKEKFDAVIIEWFFSEIGAGIAPLFNCPLIWYGSTEAHWQVLRLLDEIPNPAYSVDIFSINKPPLSFFERVTELWTMIKRYTLYAVLITPKEKSLYSKVYNELAKQRGVKIPTYEEAVYNGSFILINSHPSIGIPYKLPQNAKYIGGHHISNEVKPLPKDLQKIMDEAKHGVIYFSMGSNFKSCDMSDQMKKSLLAMFGTLQQTVIWKFETELENVPDNVHLVKWAPQQSIFTHPNLKTFITHGGQLSTTEAVHFAVPVIGIPIVADQYINMKSVVDKGFGIKVTLTEDVAVPLKEAIKQMLSTTKYKEKVKEISNLYHDRVKPGEEMAYWVELVVKSGGALHLKSPAMGLAFYEKYYLDLLFVILILFIMISIIIKRILRACKRGYKSKEKSS